MKQPGLKIKHSALSPHWGGDAGVRNVGRLAEGVIL
jgi:hypothetical protein